MLLSTFPRSLGFKVYLGGRGGEPAAGGILPGGSKRYRRPSGLRCLPTFPVVLAFLCFLLTAAAADLGLPFAVAVGAAGWVARAPEGGDGPPGDDAGARLLVPSANVHSVEVQLGLGQRVKEKT